MKPRTIIFIILSLITCALLIETVLPGIAWDGAASRRFEFLIRDQKSQRPIPDVVVQLLQPRGWDQQRQHFETNSILRDQAVSDQNGIAAFHLMCGAGGTKHAFWRTGDFIVPEQISISVSNAEHQAFSATLRSVFGNDRFPLRKKNLKAVIDLRRQPDGQN